MQNFRIVLCSSFYFDKKTIFKKSSFVLENIVLSRISALSQRPFPVPLICRILAAHVLTFDGFRGIGVRLSRLPKQSEAESLVLRLQTFQKNALLFESSSVSSTAPDRFGVEISNERIVVFYNLGFKTKVRSSVINFFYVSALDMLKSCAFVSFIKTSDSLLL